MGVLYLYNMNLKKIIREEIDDLEWIQEDWIEGKELRKLLLKTGADTIPFKEVRGDLGLHGTQIKDLGNLEEVGGDLDLGMTKIKDLGNLQSVGGWLDLLGTPISKMYSEMEIRAMVNVHGDIYL